MKFYYLHRQGQVFGLYSHEDLEKHVKTGSILAEELVCLNGTEDWKPLSFFLKASTEPPALEPVEQPAPNKPRPTPTQPITTGDVVPQPIVSTKPLSPPTQKYYSNSQLNPSKEKEKSEIEVATRAKTQPDQQEITDLVNASPTNASDSTKTKSKASDSQTSPTISPLKGNEEHSKGAQLSKESPSQNEIAQPTPALQAPTLAKTSPATPDSNINQPELKPGPQVIKPAPAVQPPTLVSTSPTPEPQLERPKANPYNSGLPNTNTTLVPANPASATESAVVALPLDASKVEPAPTNKKSKGWFRKLFKK